MAHIFISYSRADGLFIAELVPLLRQVFSEHDVWFDEHITGGEDWWQRILGEIARCDLFIYLLSNDAVASEYCQAEFQEALRLQKLCLPVIVRPKTDIDKAPPDLAAEIRRRNWIDMSGGFRDYRANAKLYAAVNRQLAALPQNPLPPLFNDPVSKPEVTQVKRSASRRLTGNQVTILVAIIGLVGTIGAALITTMLRTPDNNAGPPAVFQSTSTSAPSDTPTLSPTNPPTWTPYVTPTPILTPIPLGFPGNPVTRNAQWTPISQPFNGVEMVLVPVGCFMMGSEDGYPGGPVHQQCFDKQFWIDRYEVTNAQFGSIGCVSYSTQPNHPRNCVDWAGVRDYCESRGARLPTEVEWEYAARGPDGLVYPWGNEFVGENVVYLKNSGEETAEVGSRPRGMSWVGAFDLSGNVWEWVSTAFDNFDSSIEFPYPYDPNDGREDMDRTDVYRVVRGGSFYDNDNNLRAANRDAEEPVQQFNSLGFRCALSE